MLHVQAHFSFANKSYKADLTQGHDLSLSFGPKGDNPNAFHINEARCEPIVVGDFVGSVKQGSGANCDVITFCAHGNGTHTECCGHITADQQSINKHLPPLFCIAQLITLNHSVLENGDEVVQLSNLQKAELLGTEAIIIRTLPNANEKRGNHWSGNNPLYYSPELLEYFAAQNYMHLLIDVPSVDREEDGGKMLAHKAWWQYNNDLRTMATITEMVYVDNSIPDGLYLLNLQVAPVESDAAPSRPVIFELTEA